MGETKLAMRRLKLMAPPELIERVKAHSDVSGVPMQRFIRRAIEDALVRAERQK